MLARLHALVGAAAATFAVLATPAAADPIVLPDTRATLLLGTEWRPAPAPGVVAGYRAAGGLVLAITRAAVPNPDAWRAKTRDAYVDEIERGIAASVAGYRRIVRRIGEANGVPVLDLEARGTDRATLVIRILLFRTYALALAIEVPRGADAGRARLIAATFAPPPP